MNSIYNIIFSGLVYHFFMIFYLKLGFIKQIEVMKPIYIGKFLICPKWGKWDIFRPNINFLNFS